ncbi:transcription elongation factor 1 homolog [Sphaeramia orbicularis]|uniref:transcription elongation factor 1 homolog n=1 Tax=Sphaeramia orbicularis TaxID=375764 RepID=UPI00117D00C0|nr:transcription elongation factor 1 homolog [Sphaeramia orbicularis]
MWLIWHSDASGNGMYGTVEMAHGKTETVYDSDDGLWPCRLLSRSIRIKLNTEHPRVIRVILNFTNGAQKSKRKPPPKKKMTGNLDTQFTCPFCNHEKSCDVKMERTRNTGIISCSVCLEEFQTPITYLSEPVDVYSDWIDACEAANQ